MGDGASSHLWGLAGVGLNVTVQVWGQQGRDGEQVAASALSPAPASSLELLSGGHLGQHALEIEGPGLKGPRTC